MASVAFGEVLDGEAALRASLVWKCVDDDALMPTAREFAAKAAAAPKELLVSIKKTVIDIGAVPTHTEAVEFELGPQVWSTRQPWFRERLAALASEIGEAALAVDMDVTNEASTIAAFDAAAAHFGPVDTVIANAGVSVVGRATEIPADDLRMLFDTNLLGLYLTAREGARRMIAGGAGVGVLPCFLAASDPALVRVRGDQTIARSPIESE